MPAFVPEMLAAFQLHDVVGRKIAHALDVGQREGVGLFANFHHQAAHYRQGQRHLQVEATALPRRLLQHHRAAQLAHHMLHRIQADPAPRDLGDLVPQAEPRQEQEREQFLFAQAQGGFQRRQMPIDDGAAQALQVDTVTVVAQLQHQQAGLVRRPQADQAFSRFAGQQALLGHFNAVVHSIAQ
eukprot:gene16150-biopygen16266